MKPATHQPARNAGPAAQWFSAYVNAVETTRLLLECTTQGQSEAFWRRTMQSYRAAKGLEYADCLHKQVEALFDGVHAMRMNGSWP